MDMELLSPAGSPACALAAFDAGADAVYAGLSKFNARERGENFTPDMMKKIVDYAHAHSKKVYLTLNTLLREAELPELLETLDIIDDIAPDGVLVQDLGVLRLAREYYPDLILHGSTQMGFHNSAGLQMAEKLGLSRVVLERQITMEELAAIRKQTRLELEVFVHGSLCCSLSGVCLFSSYLGGWSGNRGKCKQPCRRRYFSKQGNGFFFSPQDLAAIELLPQLRKIGVQSLKIEGRLRQPDYVTNTVAAYRMMLDCPEKDFAAALPEARNLLSKGCGRRWSHGFYTMDSAKELIKSDAVGAAGLRVGTVEAVMDNGFGLTAQKRIHIGDRLR
ncbi:MAG: U32 family peptidase, partial [Lentisphaeria bacterium]|nr:U32 family peptidase [Lentisphaeria bacterium]